MTADVDRCKAPDCTRSAREKGGALGYCSMHYQRFHRTGATERVRPEGDFAQVVFRLPRPDYKELERLAKKGKTTLADILREAVAFFLRAR